MAVITAMKFSDFEGAIISDEKIELNNKEYVSPEGSFGFHDCLSAKLGTHSSKKSNFVVGCVSKESFDFHSLIKKYDSEKHRSVLTFLKKEFKSFKKNEFFKDFFEYHAKKKLEQKHEHFFYELFFDKEKVKTEEPLISAYDQLFLNPRFDFIIMEKHNSKKIKLYTSTDLKNIDNIDRTYHAIGPNSNISILDLDKIQAERVNGTKKRIPPEIGLLKLLKSTQYASTKTSLYNKPSIAIFNNDELIVPSNDCCSALFDISKMNNKHVLNEDHALDLIKSLVYEKSCLNDVVNSISKELQKFEKQEKYFLTQFY